MTRAEVREHVEAELLRRGIEKPTQVSNEQACVIFGLVPETIFVKGGPHGSKLLAKWANGEFLPWAALNGEPRHQISKQVHNAVVNSKRSESKKVIRAEVRRKLTANHDFFSSHEWREARYMVLQIHGGICQLCGRGRKDGVIIHVDHIKPRSKYPELALVINNLQILCEDCNLGKSNKDETDWRGVESRGGEAGTDV